MEAPNGFVMTRGHTDEQPKISLYGGWGIAYLNETFYALLGRPERVNIAYNFMGDVVVWPEREDEPGLSQIYARPSGAGVYLPVRMRNAFEDATKILFDPQPDEDGSFHGRVERSRDEQQN